MPKILLVEDNSDISTLMCRRLEQNGYNVVVAENGEQGVAFATSENPDLILMDLNMPVLDGLEATRQIKMTANMIDMPIIALSAHTHEGDEERAREVGCIGYHAKPIQLEKLLLQIEKCLRSQQSELADDL